MSQKNLATYLNDHLSGSVVALELLDHLISARAGSGVEALLKRLRSDIANDRRELEGLMSSLEIRPSPVRKGMAWLAEKFTELKLRLDDSGTGPLHLLEGIEALALGVHGKQALWAALATARIPGLNPADYDRLKARAEEQRASLEAARLEAAVIALKAE